MKQLVHKKKTGEMKLLDVPVPALTSRSVTVKVYSSLISAGTEASKVSTARKGYIGKAKDQPEQVKQIIANIRKEGILGTYTKVMNKLDAWAPLGYSCAGDVIAVGEEVTSIQIGDRVACAGQDLANHAEVVSIPINLCVKIPDNVTFEAAAYTTIGSIALQGIRQADLRLGESCVVIGLGLLGQLTVQMLKVSGIFTFGIDVSNYAVKKAIESGADFAFERSFAGLEQEISNLTGGYGADAVIITAGTSSLDPIELSGRIARKKGRIVVVGAVPTGFSRENYFKKELDLRMSSSYGPGRYDALYEEKGIDYPYAYVRWTEKRNMKAFLDLISGNKIRTAHLTTHVFDIDESPTAYDMIIERSEPFLGILLKYHPEREVSEKILLKKNLNNIKLKIGFIGAGSFAQSYLIPNIKRFNNAELVGVATGSGHNSLTNAQRYGFSFATCNTEDIYNANEINTVFVATRHNLHAEIVLNLLRKGKNIFVEKPLCMTHDELEFIREEYQKSNSRLLVGFNRRFAPHIQKIKKIFSREQPKAIIYRVNAGYIPKDHWVQDKEIGGGRIIGEVCHFVDLAMFISGSLPASLSAHAMYDPSDLLDTLSISIKFKNGSIASISYFSNGSKELPKEYIEIYSGGITALVDDFKTLSIYDKKIKKYKMAGQDKGHKDEIYQFLSALNNGEPMPITFDEIYWSTKMTFDIVKSIQTKEIIIY